MEKRNGCFLVKMKCLVLNLLSSCHFEVFAHFFPAKEIDLLELWFMSCELTNAKNNRLLF